jgi:hypothetical protein
MCGQLALQCATDRRHQAATLIDRQLLPERGLKVWVNRLGRCHRRFGLKKGKDMAILLDRRSACDAVGATEPASAMQLPLSLLHRWRFGKEKVLRKGYSDSVV